jgi:predicted amidohydrolase
MMVVSVPTVLQVSCVQLHWAQTLEKNLARTLHYIDAAAEAGSRVVLFPEATLTGYYFPYLTGLAPDAVRDALRCVCEAARAREIWVIAGTIQKHGEKYLNIAHVIDPRGQMSYEYAKVHMAGRDEMKYCRGGNKIAFFEIDGIPCTLAICRDGRHPELYRIPAMAGAKIFFHPSCSSDEIEAVEWKRVSGRAQLQAGPTTGIYHCVANTIGQPPDGKQSSSGQSFIRDVTGLPLAEAGFYQEEMITAVLDLSRAAGNYAKDSMTEPPFLRHYWQDMIAEMKARADSSVYD